jgi:hypothetical protein
MTRFYPAPVFVRQHRVTLPPEGRIVSHASSFFVRCVLEFTFANEIQ